MAYTWTTLTEQLGVYLANVGDSDYASVVEQVVADAQLMILRDVDFQATRKYERRQFGSSGTGADARLAGPSDLVICRSMGFFTPVGTTDDDGIYNELIRVDETFLSQYWPNRTVRGVPKYYTEAEVGQLIFAPTPDAAYWVKMGLTYRLASITAAAPTNWISENVGDLLFAACMYKSTQYQKNFGAQADDPKMAASWAQEYERLKTQAIIDEARRKSENWANATVSQPPAETPPKLQ